MASPADSPPPRGAPAVLSPAARLAAERRRLAARTRRRRYTLGGLAALVVVAAGVVSCGAVSHGSSGGSGKSGGSTHDSSTTSTTLPQYATGLLSFTASEPGASTVNPTTGGAIPGRSLTVEVRYPASAAAPGRGAVGGEMRGATPAKGAQPFPVIVFAHGFETLPATYAPLLDQWVRAGFVVVSPVFPDENEETVSHDGGLSSAAIATNLESDESNEPADLVFTVHELETMDAAGSGSPLSGLLDLRDVALAGQSDGANVVAALLFDARFASQLAAMPVGVKAVAVLSGQPLAVQGDSYAASATSPPVLFVQSDKDTCNLPSQAALLYSDLANDPHRFFVELLGAQHLPPYTGVPPYAAVVGKVTTTFFEHELGWRDKGLLDSSVTAAGTAPGLARVYTGVVPSLPNPGAQSCPAPPPLPTGGA